METQSHEGGIFSNGIFSRFNVADFIAILVFSIPLSIKIFLPAANSEIIYPAEILIGASGLYFIFKIIKDRKSLWNEHAPFIKHPTTILILLYILINFIAVFFSTMHLVSLKAVAVKTCYIAVFYFLIQLIAVRNLRVIIELILIYSIAFLLVIIYTLINHYHFGLTREIGGYMSVPFYQDHTIYGSACAFVFALISVFIFFFRKEFISRKYLFGLIILAVVIFIGLIFSYCRAAWLSIAVTFILVGLIKMGLKFKHIMIASLLIFSTSFILRNSILNFMSKNKYDSNAKGATVSQQLLSYTNITNDLSNAERLNRWHCAVRMFKEKPLTGFGPGTFQFQYLSFQNKNEMTYISVKELLPAGVASYNWSPVDGLKLNQMASAYQGNGGSAHSEFFLELAEGGIFSLLLYTGIFISSLFSFFKIHKSSSVFEKYISMAAIAGLATYFVHSFFNNFLDDCKIAFLFWASISVVTMCDLLTRKKDETVTQQKIIDTIV